MNPAEIILFANGARAGGDSPFLDIIEKARGRAYRDKAANSTFTGFDYGTMDQRESTSVNRAYNVDEIPQVVIIRDGEVIGRVKNQFITEDAVYESIVRGVPGEGENKPTARPGSGGVLPLLDIQGIQNALSNLLRNMLSDPRKIAIALLVIALIAQRKRRR